MVDNLTFDDGEPITQNKLQSLYNAIKVLEGQAAVASIKNATDNTVSTAVTFCGRTPTITLSKSWATKTINFDGFNFESDMVRIIVTPGRGNSGGLNIGSIDYYVSNVTRSGFILNTSSQQNSNKNVYFDYIAVMLKTTIK